MKCEFAARKNKLLRVLCLGAHSDDIEIGCGGTLLRLMTEYDDVSVCWVVFGASGLRAKEARASARKFLAGASKRKVIIRHFRESYFPYSGNEVKSFFDKLKESFSPDIIFTHYRHDLHQDHRLISDLTWNTFRNHFILEYEIMKYDGDFGVPNFYVHLSEQTCRSKIDYLMKCFETQTCKDWFTADAFFSILRIRGIESKAPEKFAEAYYCRKMIV